MKCILKNNTSIDIAFDELGITVPANSEFDLTYLPPVVRGRASKLKDYVANSAVSVLNRTESVIGAPVDEPFPNSVGWEVISNGVVPVTVDGVYTQIAAGPTTSRPVPALDGMTRFNTTKNVLELFHDDGWYALSPAGTHSLEVESLNGLNGVVSDPLLFVRNGVTDQALSVATLNFPFSHAGPSNKTWLQIDSNITDANVGYESPFEAAIIGITGSVARTNKTKSVSIYVNNTEYTNALTFQENGGYTATNLVAIPISAGDKVRARLVSENGNQGAVAIQIILKWRK